MENKKIYFEEADHPPPSYYGDESHKQDESTIKNIPFNTINPEEWLKAPEFVPRSRLSEAFDLPQLSSTNNYSSDDCHGYANVLAQFPPNQLSFSHCLPPLQGQIMLPPNLVTSQSISNNQTNLIGPNTVLSGPLGPQTAPTLTGIPQGYSANITQIQAGYGTPIPAIVLRKKRRKRNRHTNSVIAITDSPTSMTGNDEQEQSGSPEAQVPEQHEHKDLRQGQVLGGSCPDLSEEQMQMWDDYLYDTTVKPIDFDKINAKNDKRNNNDIMVSSGYEVVSKRLLDIAEEHVQGISNPEIRRLDKELNDNPMTSSTVIKNLSSIHEQRMTSDAKTEQNLADELEAVDRGDKLHFRPQLTKYGYPQIDCSTAHVATFHPSGVRSKIVSMKKYDSDDERFEEDCFEGMNITVNAFDTCEDLSLSDIELSANPSRFDQIQKALKRNSLRYEVGLKPPERVCCALM